MTASLVRKAPHQIRYSQPSIGSQLHCSRNSASRARQQQQCHVLALVITQSLSEDLLIDQQMKPSCHPDKNTVFCKKPLLQLPENALGSQPTLNKN